MEYVGSGTNYDALPWNGGVPVPANQRVELNNGRVFGATVNEKGDFEIADGVFSIDGTTGAATINTSEFNLSGLNFIGPFSRNGGFSTVGVQLREVSDNTTLIASTGTSDGNTAPTQNAVKTYVDALESTLVARIVDLEQKMQVLWDAYLREVAIRQIGLTIGSAGLVNFGVGPAVNSGTPVPVGSEQDYYPIHAASNSFM